MQENKVNNNSSVDPWDDLSSENEESDTQSDTYTDTEEEQIYTTNFNAETGTLYTESFEMLNSPLVKKIEFDEYFNLPLDNLKFYPNFF